MPVITVAPTGEEIFLPVGETVLGGLYAAGYAYTVGCRRGGCGVCKVDLLEGVVSYNRRIADDVLTAQERDDGICLTCRAVPQTDIRIGFRTGSLRLVHPVLRSINHQTRLRSAASVLQTKE